MATVKSALAPRAGMAAPAWDSLMVALAGAHAALLIAAPSAPVIALGLWWNSNTISHNFIHRPFFRSRTANVMFGAYLSALLGFPQLLWRDRHLAHHAGVPHRLRLSGELILQAALVVVLWSALAAASPAFFLYVYLPGYVAGLSLCAIHGYFEHASGTTSHYGKLYNVLCFNDGYHAEHHANPAVHWSHLPERAESAARASSWPAPLRWLEAFSPRFLAGLERLALRSNVLQRFMLRTHARAFRRILSLMPTVERVGIIGGGLFPRTAMVVRELLPSAGITIIEGDRANLERARMLLDSSDIEYVHAWYPDVDVSPYDLLIVPLSFTGDRSAVYAHPPAPAVIMHDWIWRKRGRSSVVSVALLKRINLIEQ